MAQPDPLVPLTAEDLRRFHRNAPTALARRSGDFTRREIARGCEQLLTGLIPLVGLWQFGWSAVEMTLFLLARLWMGSICDLLKLCCLHDAIMRQAAVRYDDWHVWVVAQSLRTDTQRVPRSHLQATYRPWQGVFIDFVFGGISTVVIGLALATGADAGMETSWAKSFLLTVALSAVGQFYFAISDIVATRSSDTGRQVTITSGGRGLALFLLMFVAVAAREAGGSSGNTATWLIIVANLAWLVAGGINLGGQWLVKRETEWLREYLSQSQSQRTAPARAAT